MNKEEDRFINASYTREDFYKYEQVFKNIKDTGCTAFKINSSKGPILEGLYDVALRKGDMIVVGATSLDTMYDNVEEPYLSKRKEFIEGVFVQVYREWYGDLGEQLKIELSELYPDITYMCMAYDTVSTFKNAIIYLIEKERIMSLMIN